MGKKEQGNGPKEELFSFRDAYHSILGVYFTLPDTETNAKRFDVESAFPEGAYVVIRHDVPGKRENKPRRVTVLINKKPVEGREGTQGSNIASFGLTETGLTHISLPQERIFLDGHPLQDQLSGFATVLPKGVDQHPAARILLTWFMQIAKSGKYQSPPLLSFPKPIY